MKNAISASAGWLLTVLVAVVSTPVIAKWMGLETYGVYALVASFLGFSTPLDFGVGQAVTRTISGYKAVDDTSGLNRCLVSGLNISLLAGSFLAIGVVWLAPVFTRLLDIPPAMHHEVVVSFSLGGSAIVVSIAGGVLNSALMGLQRYDLTSLINASTAALVAILTIVMVALKFPLSVVVFCNALVLLAGCITLWRLLSQNIPALRYRLSIDLNELRTLLRFGSFAFLPQVSSLFSTHVVRFTIGILLGPVAVSCYVIPARLISAIGGVFSSGFGVLFPFASERSARGEKGMIRSSYIESSRVFAALAIPLLLVTALFSYSILTVWMGHDFAEMSAGLLRLLAWSGLIASLTTVPNTIVLGLGHSRIIGLFSLFSVLIYSVLLPSFTERWGLPGVAVVGLIATIPGLILVGIQTKRIIEVPIRDYLRDVLGFHFVPLVVAVVLTISFSEIQVGSAWATLTIAFALSVFYFSAMAVVSWIDIGKILTALRGHGG